MSEQDSKLPVLPEPPQRPRPRRLRRFLLHHLPLSIAGGTILLTIATVFFYFWASSSMVEGFVRKRLVAYLEEATGGRVEIATFHWRLLDLEADAGGLVIHGREAAGEAPYAQAERLRAQISILGLLSPRILLRDLELSRPAFHLIVYPDGSTNQPCHASRAKLESPRSIPYSTSRPAAFHSVGEFSTTKIGPQPLTSRTASSRSTSTPEISPADLLCARCDRQLACPAGEFPH